MKTNCEDEIYRENLTPPNHAVWDVTLPQQPCSTTAYTTQFHQSLHTQVPELEAFRDRSGKRPPTPEPSYVEPQHPQTILVYDAWLQQSVVTVARKRDDVKKILKGEAAELRCRALTDPLAAAARRDPDAADPREFALTLLIKDSNA